MVWQEYESVEKSALWFLGQSGFYLKSGGVSVVIDPYLSDCVGENSPLFTRIYPAPVSPYDLKADIYIVTHDHLDHLDPATIRAYSHKEETIFVAPRHAAKKLEILGINPQQIRIVDQGDGLAEAGSIYKAFLHWVLMKAFSIRLDTEFDLKMGKASIIPQTLHSAICC